MVVSFTQETVLVTRLPRPDGAGNSAFTAAPERLVVCQAGSTSNRRLTEMAAVESRKIDFYNVDVWSFMN